MSGAAGALMDGHVHYHACFELARFLDAAAANVRHGAEQLGLPPRTPGALMFTESAGCDAFACMRRSSGTRGWRFEPTAEPSSLLARSADGALLLIVAGRQIVTRERLEVLALAAVAGFPDGRSLVETVAAVRASGALAVIPWGFGKWWFSRGDVVAAALAAAANDDDEPLFLGDNAGRLRLAPSPGLFRRASRSSVWVIPGSDPLPFPSQQRRVGGYGCHVEGPVSESRPARDLTAWLRRSSAQPRVYGRLSGLAAFCKNQVAMQLRKRLSRAA
jgi:hypothetical protein